MKFSQKVKYKYLQESYGKKHNKKKQPDIMKAIEELDSYIDKNLKKLFKTK